MRFMQRKLSNAHDVHDIIVMFIQPGTFISFRMYGSLSTMQGTT